MIEKANMLEFKNENNQIVVFDYYIIFQCTARKINQPDKEIPEASPGHIGQNRNIACI